MKKFFTALAIFYSLFAYNQQIVPITNSGMSWGTAVNYTQYGNEIYALFITGNSSDSSTYVIDKFNGTTWTHVTDLVAQRNERFSCLQFWNNKLCIGGTFLHYKGIAGANCIMAYHNNNFEALGSGITLTDTLCGVSCMAVYNNKLIAAGHFSLAGGVPFHPVAQWDSASWSNVGYSMYDPACLVGAYVSTVLVDSSKLYLQGVFLYADSATVHNITYYENGIFHTMGAGFPVSNGGQAGLIKSGGNIFTTVLYPTSGGGFIQHLVKWDGNQWMTVFTTDTSISNSLSLQYMVPYNNGLVVSGYSLSHTGYHGGIIYDNNTISGLEFGDTASIWQSFVLNNEVYFWGDFQIKGYSGYHRFAKVSFPTSMIEAATISPQLSIYPNPANTQLNIQIDETLTGVQLNIYDMNGAMVQKTVLQIPISQLQIQNLPTGIYIAELKTKEMNVKKMWVKM